MVLNTTGTDFDLVQSEHVHVGSMIRIEEGQVGLPQ